MKLQQHEIEELRAKLEVEKTSLEEELASHGRILNDAGRPFLYPPTLFSVLDNREPGDWVTEIGDDGERYSYPSPLNKPGFFEDFFDQKTKAVATFWRIVNRRLAASSKVA